MQKQERLPFLRQIKTPQNVAYRVNGSKSKNGEKNTICTFQWKNLQKFVVIACRLPD